MIIPRLRSFLYRSSGYHYVWRKSSSAVEKAKSFYVGQKLHGYTIKEIETVSELSLTAIKLNHDKTNAEHLHISRDDVNNTFGVAFRTTPDNDAGAPHILEHTALCGSQKYPVRDPFFKMLNRSLSTFMNAFTASDWTMYPFTTQNSQDYKNLMSVYLDASFFPRLSESDFRQEGWRLEHSDVNDQNSDIIIKGIVYNEMKGVFSNSHQLYHQRLQNLLLPSNTYAVVSGGLPSAIPTLDWPALKAFHAEYYHPSNARFYTYGSFDLEEHLKTIDDVVLQRFQKSTKDTSVPMETRWSEQRKESIQCASNPLVADASKQTTISVSYLLDSIQDTDEMFTWQLLSHLLVGGDTSPFASSLLDSNIGSDLSPGTGFSGDIRDSSFTVGLQGIKEDDCDKVLSIIEDTLDKVISDGFNPDHISAFLHMIELGIKHQTNSFGLNIGVNILPAWNHDGCPMKALQINRRIEVLKEKIAKDSKYLQNKVQQKLKNNTHKLTLKMSPSDDFESERTKAEKLQLDKLVKDLSTEEKQQVFIKGKELNDLQNQVEDISCLPTLTINDISKSSEEFILDKHSHDNVFIQSTVQPTNDLTFLNMLSSFEDLPSDMIPYVPLFSHVATKMAAGDMDFKQFNDTVDLYTGGLSCSPIINDHPSSTERYQKALCLSSYCLNRNTDKMFSLWTEVFHRLDMSDTNRLRTLVQSSAGELAFGIDHQGHRYAMTNAAASLSAKSQLVESITGLSQVRTMKTISELEDLDEVVEKLKSIAVHLLNKNNLRCSVVTTDSNMTPALNTLHNFISSLPGQATAEVCSDSFSFYNKDTGYVANPQEVHQQLPFQVNFLGRVCTTVPYAHKDFASLRILGNVMTSKFLHREIREKGGAYGGGASGDSSNQFKFYSYRDPAVTDTVERFDDAVQWACLGGGESQRGFTSQDIDEAKLSIFSKLDAPTPPGVRGNQEFLYGISSSDKQAYRQRLFDVNKDDLVSVAERYLKIETRKSSMTLIGPENELTTKCSGWKVLTSN